jgi:hypothetical protein
LCEKWLVENWNNILDSYLKRHIICAGGLSSKMKKKRCSCVLLVSVVLLATSAGLMITTLLSHAGNVAVADVKPPPLSKPVPVQVKETTMNLVDALGRPLVFQSYTSPIAAESSSQVSNEVKHEPLSDYLKHQQSEDQEFSITREEEVEPAEQQREELEAGCLALVLDNSPHAPAEPSALASCRKVLDEMAKRNGAKKKPTAMSNQQANPVEHDDRFSPLQVANDVNKESHAESGDGFMDGLPIQVDRAKHTAKAPPHTAANLRNEGERCNLMPNHNSPPVLLWRSKRVGGSTLAALLVRYAFIHKLQIAGPQGRMATRVSVCGCSYTNPSTCLHAYTYTLHTYLNRLVSKQHGGHQ